VAVLVGKDDGVSPVLRLDSIGRHSIGAGSSQQAVFEKLVSEPLARLGLGFQDVDKYATELQNPEVTEPAGSGDVARRNYQVIGALAVLNQEITRSDIPSFIQTHGMPGFSPTQGHIASGIPFLGHALDRVKTGTMQRVMFLARGSLFLGRMTQMSDGLSFLIEKNPNERS
jgi:betaine reductase